MLSLFSMENVCFPFQSAISDCCFEWLDTSERDFKTEIMLMVSHEWSQSSN